MWPSTLRPGCDLNSLSAGTSSGSKRGLYEFAQVETRVGAPGLVLLDDLLGILQRPRVDEALAVFERALHLNPLEKAGIQIDGVGGAAAPIRARRAGDQAEQQPRGPTHHATCRPDQNS